MSFYLLSAWVIKFLILTNMKFRQTGEKVLKMTCIPNSSSQHLHPKIFIPTSSRFKHCSSLFISLSLFSGVQDGYRPPRITEHPTSAVVPRGDPTTLNCKADGFPEPTIEWFKDGVALSSEIGSHRIPLPAGSLFFLSLVHGKKESDTGEYWCVARNELGSVSSRHANLDVAGKENFCY